MGDLITNEVTGILKYVPYREFERIDQLINSKFEKVKVFSQLCRINTLYMIAKAGSGHIGSSFSSIDIIAWLYMNEMQGDVNNNTGVNNDIFFSSKGHDAPAIYSVLIGIGKLNFDLLHKLRRIDGLPGHPDNSLQNIITNTGSLGMGISKAKGMIIANRLLEKKNNIYVLTGDGELQEGQIWESLISAANNKMCELTVIVDHNKLQSDTLVEKVSDLGMLEAKFTAFGWSVSRCDGNDINQLSKVLENNTAIIDKPKVIIADTIKGKGVSFMEHTSIDSDVEYYKFHSGAPNNSAYSLALEELINSTNNILESLDVEGIALECIDRPIGVSQENYHKLIPAYSKALIKEARLNYRLVALNADLIVDTGLLPFKEKFPNRFIECGIAEQDMVSQAGGMALIGLLPIVHSFACFLSSRPNEQIYNNSTELSKIIYVGSLTGLIPAGPGHSHQAVRDIASLSAIPGLTIIEPCCENEVESLLNWAIEVNNLSTYIRMVSAPFQQTFDYSKKTLIKGRGTYVKKGEILTVITSGPIFSELVIKLAEMIEKRKNIIIQIIITPWLNSIDIEWYRDILDNSKFIAIIDNHYIESGLGDYLVSNLGQAGILKNKDIKLFGLKEKPKSGQQKEVMEYHQLDIDSIYFSLIDYIEKK
jgi:transketolase